MNPETVIKILISQNRVYEVRGPSGAGKTTFLRAVAYVSYKLQMPFIYVGIKELPSSKIYFRWEWIRDRLEEVISLTTSGYRPGLSMLASRAREFDSLADYLSYLNSPKIDVYQREVAQWLGERVQRIPIARVKQWPQYTAIRISGIDGVLQFGALFVSLPFIEQLLRIRPVLLIDDISPLMASGNRVAFEAILQTIRSFSHSAFVVIHDYPRTEELLRPVVLAPASGAGEMIHRLVKRNKYVILDNSNKYEIKFEDVLKLAKRFEEIPFGDVEIDEGVPPTGAQQIYKAVLCIT